MKKYKFFCLLWILLGSSLPPAYSQSRFDTLTKALQQIFEKDGIPGMSVMLVDAKKVIYEHNFGYANVAQRVEYSSQSIQNIGSVSKTFAAMALMKAIEFGYFGLDTDINTILPFKVVNPKYPNSVITLKQLSTHTSGIIDNPSLFYNTYQFDTNLDAFDTIAYNGLQKLGFNQKISDSSLKDFMYDYLSVKGNYYNKDNFGSSVPGTAYNYSNFASALVAYLIELRSGMTYAEFTTRYILKPIKMKNSSWFINPKQLERFARPYYNRNLVFPYYHAITYPDGGLRTNTADLSKYLIALINGYNGNKLLLEKSSYSAMFAAQFSKENTPSGINLNNRNKGIFWNLYTSGAIGHDGDDPGVSSFVVFNPITGLGGVFLCNIYLADKTQISNLLIQFANGK